MYSNTALPAAATVASDWRKTSSIYVRRARFMFITGHPSRAIALVVDVRRSGQVQWFKRLPARRTTGRCFRSLTARASSP